MAERPTDPLVRYIRRLAEVQQNNLLSDRELLYRFAVDQNQAAFTALVRRHGAMVLRVCRRVLRQDHDAEDAFQATFMVLSRQASSRRWHESINKWLYKVAHRVALERRAAILRRQARESQVDVCQVMDPRSATSFQNAEAVLDEELMRLPESLRLPLVLCCLEGQTHRRAAQQLGCSESTIIRRISQARELLRSRLASRGVVLSTALLVSGLANEVMAAELSALFVGPTVRAAVAFVVRQGDLKTNISAQAATLADGVLHAMVLTKMKLGAALLAATLMVGTVSALVCQTLVSPTSGKTARTGQPGQTRTLVPSGPKQPVPVDAYGDPLPEDALARLRTVRWRHGASISFVNLLPDGKSVLTASLDRTARLWDLATGKQRCCFDIDVPAPDKSGYVKRPLLAAFSPASNILATSGDGVVIRLHDVTTGKEYKPLRGPAHGFGALTLSPDGRCLAAAEPNGTIHIWEPTTGKVLRRLDANPLKIESDSMKDSLTFTADGKTLLWAGVLRDPSAATVKVWDFASGKELRQFTISGGNITAGGIIMAQPTFSMDGKKCACVSASTMSSDLYICDVVTGQKIRSLSLGCVPFTEETVPVGVAFSPDGKIFAIRYESEQQLVELWDTATGMQRWQIGEKTQRRSALRFAMNANQMNTNHLTVTALTFSSDSKILAVGGEGNMVRLLDVATGRQLRSVDGHQASVSTVCFGPDSKTLLSQDKDDTIRL